MAERSVQTNERFLSWHSLFDKTDALFRLPHDAALVTHKRFSNSNEYLANANRLDDDPTAAIIDKSVFVGRMGGSFTTTLFVSIDKSVLRFTRDGPGPAYNKGDTEITSLQQAYETVHQAISALCIPQPESLAVTVQQELRPAA